MKKIWVKIQTWNKELVEVAAKSKVDALVVPRGMSSKIKGEYKINTVAPDGDLILGRDVVEVSGNHSFIIKKLNFASTLENHMTDVSFMIEVSNAREAEAALNALKNIDGVVLDTEDPKEIEDTVEIIRTLNETPTKILLSEVIVVDKKPLGTGDRVCVDACSTMGKGMGMLAGNTSRGLFLVHAESIETKLGEKRQFRVNLSTIHAYTLVPGNKTKYLSELKSGSNVLVVDYKGNVTPTVVGRVKIEKRPLVLIEAKKNNSLYSIIVQNIDKLHLLKPNGDLISIAELKKGDAVLAYLSDSIGRHFGESIDEFIIEQ